MPRSYSQLNTYQRCPKQFEFGYIKKIPRGGISAGESFGSSVHNTLKKWGEREMDPSASLRMTLKMENEFMQIPLFVEEEKNESIDLSLDVLIDLFHQSFIVEGYRSKAEVSEARARGEAVMKQYFEYWSRQERVVAAVESGFRLPLDELIITGRFDRIEQIEGGLKVIDFKTSQPRSQAEADADLQLSVYALACEQLFKQSCLELAWQFLGSDGVTEVITKRTAEQLAEARAEIVRLNGHIEAGDFTATPSLEVCRCCPYNNVCPQRMRE